MLRDMLRSKLATALLGLSAALFSIASCNAAPANCPAEVVNLHPTNGDLFIASSANPVQRVREGRGEVTQPIVLKPDAHISFYYFVAPSSPTTPMIFALIRGYKIHQGRSTSLDPDEVGVSNSKIRGTEVSTKDYVYFHDEKRHGPNVLRSSFHMWFSDRFFSRTNSYDDLDDPDVYALPAGNGYNGFKARMQRIQAFPQDGRCVVFTLFRHKSFAEALASFSLSLISLTDDRNRANDVLKFSIGFASP